MMNFQMLQPVNVAGAVQQGFQQGQEQRRAHEVKSAMQALLANPADPKAISALGAADPAMAMRYKTQIANQQQEAEKQRWSVIGNLAAQADSPEKWDQAVDALVANGMPEAAQFRGKFSPGLRSAFMAKGGISPPTPAQDPGIIREYQISVERGLVPPGTSYPEYVAMRNPGMQTPITIPHNVAPVSGGQQGNLPRVGDAASYEAVPPGGQYIGPDGQVRVKQGGQSGSAPAGNF